MVPTLAIKHIPGGRKPDEFDCIVIGGSMGFVKVITHIIKHLELPLRVPVVIVHHVHPSTDSYLVEHVRSLYPSCHFREAEEKEALAPENIYFSMADYHLLIEKDRTFSLSADAKVNYARPSIDVLFESAARAYKTSLISMLLTGANSDGAHGTTRVKKYGGLTIAQSPEDAVSAFMPAAAINTGSVDLIMNQSEMIRFLNLFSIYSRV